MGLPLIPKGAEGPLFGFFHRYDGHPVPMIGNGLSPAVKIQKSHRAVRRKPRLDEGDDPFRLWRKEADRRYRERFYNAGQAFL